MTTTVDLDALRTELDGSGFLIRSGRSGALTYVDVYFTETVVCVWSDGVVIVEDVEPIVADDWIALRIIDRHLHPTPDTQP